MHFLNFEVFLSYRISRIFCRRCFDYKIIMIIILRLKRELCPGGIRTHRCIRKIQPKLSPIIFFFRFIQMLQPICKNFTKLIVRRVNINVYFKLKDPFIHCSFTQRNSHLFYNKYSSITNVHNKIYPNTKLFRHLLERLQQRFKKKRKMARGNIFNSSRWKLIQIKQQVILSPESPGILFRYTGNGFINYTAITLSMNQIFIILAFLCDKSESRISHVFRLVSY